MRIPQRVELLVVGAGLAGIATAYYLVTRHGKRSVLIVDPRPPMSFTSAQSGDNYRNWWPHPTMTAFTNHSIDLMEEIAGATSNVIQMSRKGYLLATRSKTIDDLIESLHAGYRDAAADSIRLHDRMPLTGYTPAQPNDWASAPAGVDVLRGGPLVRQCFPALSADVANVVHIRRAGDISGQQLGQFMLETIRQAGGRVAAGSVRDIDPSGCFRVGVDHPDGSGVVEADVLVNAAGPFAGAVAAMLDVALPIQNIHQQKIVFADERGSVPRDLPFSIDLDPAQLDWTREERLLLTEDPQTRWLTEALPAGAHCRPEGGRHGKWVKLGWAFNRTVSVPLAEPASDPNFLAQFPEIVMRAASGLVPALRSYVDRLPVRLSHYGGYYSTTHENWPLIGPMGVDGAFIAGALSGFGTMSACAAGALCADWIAGGPLPGYAGHLSLNRYNDPALMDALRAAPSKGLL